MEILVTGGAGFIGSACVDALLERGHHLTVLDDFSTGREENLVDAKQRAQQNKLRLNVVRGSVADPACWSALPKHDAVFHFAAQTSVMESVQNAAHDFAVNAASALPLIEYLRRHRVRLLLYANTAGALYGKAAMFPTGERTLPRPLSPYGATKYVLEIYLSALCNSLKEMGEWSSDPASPNYFTWASLRLSNVYGPRQRPNGEAGVVPTFTEQLGRGQTPTIFGDGTKTRDYVHVLDVAAAFVAAFEKAQETTLDEAFNVSAGVETRDVEVFENIVRTMHEIGADPDAPEAFRNSLQVSQPQHGALRAGEAERSWVDPAKAEAIFGWRPRVDFTRGVRDTVRAYFGPLPEGL